MNKTVYRVPYRSPYFSSYTTTWAGLQELRKSRVGYIFNFHQKSLGEGDSDDNVKIESNSIVLFGDFLVGVISTGMGCVRITTGLHLWG
jgi:hypothetical protein